MRYNNINTLFDFLNLGKIENITLNDSSQNVVYRVSTKFKTYDVKEFSKDAIGTTEDLIKRHEQLRISKILDEHGILSVVPIKFFNEYFIFLDEHYYLIFEHLNMKYLDKKDMNNEHIRVLAKTLARIHSLDINSTLKSSYSEINIDFNKYLSIYRNKNISIYNCILECKYDMEQLINNVNAALINNKEKLVISHNDYKPLNILWNGMKIVLLDFDACGLSYPSACMCESAFTFSYLDNKIDYERFRVFVQSYLKEYGKKDINYLNSIYISFNGKLQWLSYMLSKSEDIDNPYEESITHMLKELVTYYKDIYALFEIIDKI